MHLVLSYWRVTWDTAVERVLGSETSVSGHAADEYLLISERDEVLVMAPPASKAVVAIQALVSYWLGEQHELALEAIVAAEIKRVRGELNRLRLVAGDTPVDQDVVL